MKNSMFRSIALPLLFSMLIIMVLSSCDSSQQEPIQQKPLTVDSVDGADIVYGVQGSGDVTVVFVHCWSCDHTFWQPQVDYFAKNYQIIWLDLAGHGVSGSIRETFSMAGFGQDVAAVVEKVGATNIILVGHSMGGPVAIEAAKILGDKVIGVVGVDTFYIQGDFPNTKAAVAEFVDDYREDFIVATNQLVRPMFTSSADPSIVDSIANQMANADQAVGVSAMSEVFNWYIDNVPCDLEQYVDKLRNINAMSSETEKPLHESVVLIPGVGHFIPQVKPVEFNQALNKIIQEFQTQ